MPAAGAADVPSSAAPARSDTGDATPLATPSGTSDAASSPGAPPEDQFGRLGSPINRTGPFYVGFVAALGALIAYALLQGVRQVSQVLTLVGIAAFLAIGLDPLVRWLQRQGLARAWAVTLVFLAVIGFVVGFAAVVLPSVVSQAASLAQHLPETVENLRNTPLIRRLDADYGVVEKLTTQLQQRVSNGQTLASLFGGLLGAGKAVASGFVSTITVLVLTLYFLASLNSIKEAGYRLVPASRRTRVRLLTDEILRRIGGYVAGQVAVASINGFLTFVLLSILGVPYAAVLAITTGILGLIPLVGATLGAVIVVLVGLFQSWQIGVGLIVYYVIYQQLENYLIAPRIMSRTVAVPGAVALISALIGATLLGVLGALVAIPLAAGVLLLVQEILIPRQEQH